MRFLSMVRFDSMLNLRIPLSFDSGNHPNVFLSVSSLFYTMLLDFFFMWNGPSPQETLGAQRAPEAPRAPEGPLGPRDLEKHIRSYKGLGVEGCWGQGGPGPRGPRGPSWGPFHIKKKSRKIDELPVIK